MTAARPLVAGIHDPAHVVGNRVDALTLAYRVTLDESVIAYLEERRAVTREHGRAEINMRGVWGEMKFGRTSSMWAIGNTRFRCRIDTKATGAIDLPDGSKEAGWVLEVIYTAQALAEMPHVGVAVLEGKRIAQSLGELHEARLRRFDLCADVAGWSIAAEDALRIVRRPQAKMTSHAKETSDATEIAACGTLHERRVITGISVCPGGALMARLYDKRAELEGCEEKAECEAERWKERGWDGNEPITRVEFQVRGTAVKEFGVRDPERWIDPVTQKIPHDLDTGELRAVPLQDVIDPIWQKCLWWVRLVQRDDERASRCSDDPRWALLRKVSFSPLADERCAARKRWRGGASVEQTLGCALSILGARGMLERRSTCEPYEQNEVVEAILRREVAGLFGAAADVTSARLIDRWGAAKGVQHLAEVGNAVVARFASAPLSVSP